MKKVLVACVGNSSRSQIAEGYLQFYGIGKAKYCSAGLHPTKVHPLAVQVMAEDNIDISQQKSKSFEAFKNQHFDYVLSMCEEITTQLPDYISADQKLDLYVPDPAAFQGSEEATLQYFRLIRDQIKSNILKFIGKELISNQLSASS
ncbi:MAG: arsenate reductase ArsC [Saprospiraceae bacterium]